MQRYQKKIVADSQPSNPHSEDMAPLNICRGCWVAHYPSYCSKYNPIERRFFPHVGRACAGMLFDSLDTVVRLMRNAHTTTGLKTTVNVIFLPKKKPTGRL